ncbi:MAG: ABC transporter substrate-binding protein [Trueperaceae bacterium]|nr:MAG: ABC transporter substrate-binding protein [Trueperaceae bacterium]
MKLIRLLAISLALLLAATAFGKTLIIGVEGSPPTFDPLGSADSRVNTPSINMYNALMQFVPGTSEVVPELAESFEVSADGMHYTFRLRAGVLFHDGSELTAEDVKYTIDRMLALQTGVARSLGPVQGATVLNEGTVRIDLEFPFPSLPAALARLYILNADLVQANEEDGDWGQKWLQNNEAGSGPFQLVSFQPEQQFTMDRFDDYFAGFGDGAADTVIMRVIKEESTRRLALERGDIDFARIGSTDSFEALADAPGIERFVNATLIQLYVAMNVNNENLSNPLVRQALTLVYDYEGHIDFVRNGLGEIARGAFPASLKCHDSSIGPSQTDIELAKQLMAEAGVPDGGFELSMAYQGTSPEETATFQILQAGAAEIGIDVKGLPMEWPAKVDLFSSVDTAPDLGTVWVFPSFPDALTEYLLDKVHTSHIAEGGFNFSFYSNPEVDALIDAAQVELDDAARCDLVEQVQQIWLEDNPYINVTVGTELAAAHDYVENFVYTSSHAFTFYAYPISIADKPE